MELVLDASVLFTALIGTGVTKNVMFSTEVMLYAPEYLFEELAEHRARIEKLSGLTAKDFDSLLEKLGLVIKPVLKERFEGFLKGAHKIISAEDDTEYVALSLSMNKIPVWSNSELKAELWLWLPQEDTKLCMNLSPIQRHTLFVRVSPQYTHAITAYSRLLSHAMTGECEQMHRFCC